MMAFFCVDGNNPCHNDELTKNAMNGANTSEYCLIIHVGTGSKEQLLFGEALMS